MIVLSESVYSPLPRKVFSTGKERIAFMACFREDAAIILDFSMYVTA